MIRYFTAVFVLWAAFCGAVASLSVIVPGPGGTAGPATAFFDAATITNSGTLSLANLKFTFAGGSGNVVRSNTFSTGKRYFEVTVNSGSSGFIAIGVVDSTQATVTPTSLAAVPAGMWLNRNDGFKANSAGSAAYGSAWGVGSVMSIGIDNSLGSGSGKVWIGPCTGGSITWPSFGDPTTGANPMYANLTGNIGGMISFMGSTGSPAVTANFGATAYACPPPSGYGNF
jgi:hypothetical protein